MQVTTILNLVRNDGLFGDGLAYVLDTDTDTVSLATALSMLCMSGGIGSARYTDLMRTLALHVAVHDRNKLVEVLAIAMDNNIGYNELLRVPNGLKGVAAVAWSATISELYQRFNPDAPQGCGLVLGISSAGSDGYTAVSGLSSLGEDIDGYNIKHTTNGTLCDIRTHQREDSFAALLASTRVHFVFGSIVNTKATDTFSNLFNININRKCADVQELVNLLDADYALNKFLKEKMFKYVSIVGELRWEEGLGFSATSQFINGVLRITRISCTQHMSTAASLPFKRKSLRRKRSEVAQELMIYRNRLGHAVAEHFNRLISQGRVLAVSSSFTPIKSFAQEGGEQA